MRVRAFSLKSCTKEGASVQGYIPDMHMYHGFLYHGTRAMLQLQSTAVLLKKYQRSTK